MFGLDRVVSGEGILDLKSLDLKSLGLKSKTCRVLLPLVFLSGTVCWRAEASAKPVKTATSTHHKPAGPVKTSQAKAGSRARKAGHGKGRGLERTARGKSSRRVEVSAESARLTRAFVASATLRPMAQQLASLRSPAGYAAVSSFAVSHPGAGAATAYLALGHAYALDRRYDEASSAFRQAARADDLLSDYADYLGAQALVQAKRYGDALPLLDRFDDRHPGSIFLVSAPLLLANSYILASNGPAAVKVLEPMLGTSEADHADFKLTLGRAYQASGDTGRAVALFRSIYVNQPLSNEALEARTQLVALGSAPTPAERKVHGDQLFNAKRYAEAEAEYNAIRNASGLPASDRDALELYSAVCDLRLKHLSRRDVDRLQATNDDTAALKLYLYAEISRTEKNRAAHDEVIAEMLAKYPNSRWFEEALYSGGNMYLLTHDSTQAIYHYKLLLDHFPNSIYAPSAHWREAWMNYRLRNYSEAARLMDEQVTRYGAGIEASSALYWRARIYEDEEHDFAHAAAYYKSLNANYTNYYYGVLARQRLAVLGTQPDVPPTAAIAAVRKLTVPDLTDAIPEDDPHVIKAKLLANAALNEYIPPEIAAGVGSSEWGALAQAQIYASFGEYTRSIQSIKHSGISFFAIPTTEVPLAYWKIIFPQPYWSDLVTQAQRNGLDPYLVASLIRQESEFNAGAISPAHAMGLMQLLPSVGKENAKKEGIRGFSPGELLNPSINLELGTRNLKSVLDRFGGQPEYALAAYNAGDVPVRQWMAAGDYKDLPEFVESIPYTETREYVEAILRNRELYRAVYGSK
jgi:soluble lytic murein transglycosylase